MDDGWKERLRALLDKAGLTMKAASLRAGLGETFVRDVLERGREPIVTKLAALAKVLGVSVSEILGEQMSETTVGPQGPEIVDPHHVKTLFVDCIITGGAHDNILNIALGTFDYAIPGANPGFARVIVASRLRCSREFAEQLHRYLGEVLSRKGPAEPSPKPPTSLIN